MTAPEPQGADEIRADIERTRAELADTVDALSHKLDVKARATDRGRELTARLEPYRVPIGAGVATVLALLVTTRIRRARRH